MGTSHVEPLMRGTRVGNRKGYTAGQWNFEKLRMNQRVLGEGIERTSPTKTSSPSRCGQDDTPMSESANIALLWRVVAAQRESYAESISTNLAGCAALGALQGSAGILREGMRVPDDVTLLWCDDQLGNIRDCRAGRGEAQRRPGFMIILTTWAGRGHYKWLNRVRSQRSGSR